jgi:ABC-type sulfate transport system permease component
MAAVARRGGLGERLPPKRGGFRGVAPRAKLVLRWIVLLIAAVFFLLPLIVALRFAGIKAFGSVISEDGFTSSLGLSLRLAVITTVITIVLMLPITVYVHLRLPGIRRLMGGITILPIVIPPVMLIVGVLQIAPGSLKARRTCSGWSTSFWPCRSPTGPSTPACAHWT